MKNTYYDVCIVGAGIAGASLAAVLGRANRSVALIDRNWEKEHSIVGELLQPSGVAILQQLGFGNELKKVEASYISGYALQLEDEWIEMAYPDEHSKGLGLRYCDLVEELRATCRKERNVEIIKGKVTGVIENSHVEGVSVQTDSGAELVQAKLTVLSQGSMKSLGSAFHVGKNQVTGFMLGLLLENCSLPYEQHGHVVLGDPAPILFYPVGKSNVRVLIDFSLSQSSLKGDHMKQYLLETVLPKMPGDMHQPFREAVAKGGFITKPTLQLAARPVLKSGVVLLGDTLNARHPITGGGMTVALSDVKLLSEKLLDLSFFNDQVVKKAVKSFYREHHKHNATINILALGLYQVFKHPVLRRACFDYLKNKSKQPMELLSGTSRSRWMLYRHFSSVAIFPLQRMWGKGEASKAYRALADAASILLPLIRDEYPQIREANKEIEHYKSNHYEHTTKRNQQPQGAGT